MCLVERNNMRPAKIFWLSFLQKNRKKKLAQGDLNQFLLPCGFAADSKHHYLAQFDIQYFFLKTH